jgi:hypothetical protein
MRPDRPRRISERRETETTHFYPTIPAGKREGGKADDY